MADGKYFVAHGLGDVTVVNFTQTRLLNETNINKIYEELLDLVEKKWKTKLILSFLNVDYLSSAVLGKLMALHKKTTAMKGKLVLCEIKPELMEIFSITKLDKVFIIKKTVEDANKEFKRFRLF